MASTRGNGAQEMKRVMALSTLAFLFLLKLCAAQTNQSNRTVDVESTQEFAAAFVDDDTTHITLKGPDAHTPASIRLEAAQFPYTLEHPCRIRRNLTIDSNPPWALLDFAVIQGKCVMSPGVIVRMQNLVVYNARLGTGVNFDIFLNSPGAIVELDNVARKRVACLKTLQDPQRVIQLPRPPQIPGPQQAINVAHFCFNGSTGEVCYDNTLSYVDVALQSAVSPDQTSYAGGYIVHMINATNACDTYASDDCVNSRGGETCVIDAINVALGNGTASSGMATSTVVAIVVPVVVGTLVILAILLGFLAKARRKRRRQAAHGKYADDPEFGMVTLTGADLGKGGGTGGLAAAVPHSSQGWHIIAYRTVPEEAAEPRRTNTIYLGLLLGTGSYGRVYRGRWLDRDVAVKVLQHNSANAQRVAQECDLMMGSRHPNVVRSLHYVTWKLSQQAHGSTNSVGTARQGTGLSDEPAGPQPASPQFVQEVEAGEGAEEDNGEDELDAQTWIVTDYCDAGNMYDASRQNRLTRHKGKPTLLPLLYRLCEVAEGMRHLHSRGILHGDLKSSNVLLATQSGAPFGHVAKVSDFGLSRALMDGQTHRSTRTLGTVTHMAPALLRSGKMSAESDVYSFGIMMWELLTGKLAFSGLHYGEVVERVVLHDERPRVPEGAPEDYCLLMTTCWAADDRSRPSFEAIRQCVSIMIDDRVQQAVQAGDLGVLEGASGRATNSATSLASQSAASLAVPTAASGPVPSAALAAAAAAQVQQASQLHSAHGTYALANGSAATLGSMSGHMPPFVPEPAAAAPAAAPEGTPVSSSVADAWQPAGEANGSTPAGSPPASGSNHVVVSGPNAAAAPSPSLGYKWQHHVFSTSAPSVFSGASGTVSANGKVRGDTQQVLADSAGVLVQQPRAMSDAASGRDVDADAMPNEGYF